MQEEIWKPVVGYEGLYEVSSFGNVRSIGNRGKILKLCVSDTGRLTVCLCKESKKRTYKVHRLVGEAFIPNPDNLPQINHKDENYQNNQVENLEWCTMSHNLHYGTRIERIGMRLRRPIMQFSKDGKFVKEYKSITEAEKCTGIAGGNISRVAKQTPRKYKLRSGYVKECKNKQAGGYLWRYKDERKNN